MTEVLEVIGAVIAILAPLVGYFIKNYIAEQKKKEDAEKEEAANSEKQKGKTQELKKKLQDRQEARRKQKEIAKEWDPD